MVLVSRKNLYDGVPLVKTDARFDLISDIKSMCTVFLDARFGARGSSGGGRGGAREK